MPRTSTFSPLVSLIVGEPSVYKTPKTKQPSDSSESCSRGGFSYCDHGQILNKTAEYPTAVPTLIKHHHPREQSSAHDNSADCRVVNLHSSWNVLSR